MINDACGAPPQSSHSHSSHTLCVLWFRPSCASRFSVFHALQPALPAAATAVSAAVVVHQYNEFVELNSCSDESETTMMSAEAQKTTLCASWALTEHGD